MRVEWAVKTEGGGGFKPEEATDKWTCPHVRHGHQGGGGHGEGHSKVLGV